MTKLGQRVIACGVALCLWTMVAVAQPPSVRVRVETALGDIVIEVDQARAPATSANFLKYVDAGHYDGGTWHRTVTLDNQPESPVKIEVIQAGVSPDKATGGFPPIALERTSVTGILHKDGVVSMARGMPDSATSGWFICINDQPSLDFGGARNPDGQGFGAFGRVVSGMDVVRRIQLAPSTGNRTTNTEAQRLTPPITIVKAARVASTDRGRSSTGHAVIGLRSTVDGRRSTVYGRRSTSTVDGLRPRTVPPPSDERGGPTQGVPPRGSAERAVREAKPNRPTRA